MNDLVPIANSIKCTLSLLGLVAVLWTKLMTLLDTSYIQRPEEQLLHFMIFLLNGEKDYLQLCLLQKIHGSDKSIKALVIAEFTLGFLT